MPPAGGERGDGRHTDPLALPGDHHLCAGRRGGVYAPVHRRPVAGRARLRRQRRGRAGMGAARKGARAAHLGRGQALFPPAGRGETLFLPQALLPGRHLDRGRPRRGKAAPWLIHPLKRKYKPLPLRLGNGRGLLFMCAVPA